MEKHHLALEDKFSSTEGLFLRVPSHPLLTNRCDVLRLQNNYISSLELAWQCAHFWLYWNSWSAYDPKEKKSLWQSGSESLFSSYVRRHLIERGGVFTLVKVVVILGGNSWKRPCKSRDSGGVQGVSAPFPLPSKDPQWAREMQAPGPAAQNAWGLGKGAFHKHWGHSNTCRFGQIGSLEIWI